MSEKFTASNGLQVAWMPDDRGIEVLQTNSEYAKKCLPESGWQIVGAAAGISDNAGFTEQSACAEALREFFLHERDQELGRWRWPESPEYVVYPVADGLVDVLRETSVNAEYSGPGRQQGISREVALAWCNEASRNFYAAARAYFAAHPLPKPLPSEPHTAWVDKHGTDIWWVDGLGVLRCCASPSSDPEKYAPFTQLVKGESNA